MKIILLEFADIVERPAKIKTHCAIMNGFAGRTPIGTSVG
jgi:hypothetical protein